jgi:hemin uptake protein HemP
MLPISGRALNGGQEVNASSRRDFEDDARPLLTLPAAQERPVTRIISSDRLFGPDREIGIEHRGALYRLKITRQGKLILNK